MSIYYQKDRRSGVTYAYRSESYLNPETGRRCTRREYMGRLDPVTGEIVPKAAPGKRNRSALGDVPGEGATTPAELARALSDCQAEVKKLREVVRDLRERNALLEKTLRSLLDAVSEANDALEAARRVEASLGWGD